MNNAATLPQKMLAAAGRRRDKMAGVWNFECRTRNFEFRRIETP